MLCFMVKAIKSLWFLRFLFLVQEKFYAIIMGVYVHNFKDKNNLIQFWSTAVTNQNEEIVEGYHYSTDASEDWRVLTLSECPPH